MSFIKCAATWIGLYQAVANMWIRNILFCTCDRNSRSHMHTMSHGLVCTRDAPFNLYDYNFRL